MTNIKVSTRTTTDNVVTTLLITAMILLAAVVMILTGCTYQTGPDYVEAKYKVTLDGRLPVDANGYSHMVLSRTKYQTPHRLAGDLMAISGTPSYPQKVFWESSHVWWVTPGDTIATIVRRNVNDQGYWVDVDTLYPVSPDSLLVPTTNPVSYTRDDGEFSGMIAPTIDMLGDTMTIQCRWYSSWYPSDTTFTLIKIILE